MFILTLTDSLCCGWFIYPTSDILDSNHLPIIFYLLDNIRTRNLPDLVDKFTDWERFQSLASELISPRTKINLEEEANKAAHDFTVSIASVYRLSTSKITLSDLNKDIPGSERYIKHKWRLWNLVASNAGSST
jgi:hypothetical protein